MNHIEITGRIISEVEGRHQISKKGKKFFYAYFYLKIEGEKEEENPTVFDKKDQDNCIEVIAFRSIGYEIKNSLKKGMDVYIIGKINLDNCPHKDGYNTYRPQVVMKEISLLEE